MKNVYIRLCSLESSAVAPDLSGEKASSGANKPLSPLDQPCAYIPDTAENSTDDETVDNLPKLDLFINPDKAHILAETIQVMKGLIKEYLDRMDEQLLDKVMILNSHIF